MTEQINEPLPRASSYFDSAVSEMIAKTVDNRIQIIVQQTIDSLNETPPAWFTREINKIDTGFNKLREDMNSGLNKLREDIYSESNRLKEYMDSGFNKLREDMDSGFKKSDYRFACLYNMFRRMNGHKAVPVPFLNMQSVVGELPPIYSVEDIDSLSKANCQTHLRAYNVEFRPNETMKLKERLRDAVGLMVDHDLSFRFGGFSN